MAKKKEEFKLPPGTPAPWMSTFSDMMTLLMCFFVLLFSMSEVDAAKFEEVAKSFQSTISIFKAGSKAVGVVSVTILPRRLLSLPPRYSSLLPRSGCQASPARLPNLCPSRPYRT